MTQFYVGQKVRASDLQAALELARGTVTQVAASGGITLTTSKQDCTGATITFTTTTAATVTVTGIFDFDCSAAGAVVGVGECVVDGVTLGGIATFDLRTAGGRDTVVQQWEPTLSGAGSHTIKLQASKTGALGTCTVNSGHTTLKIWIREVL